MSILSPLNIRFLQGALPGSAPRVLLDRVYNTAWQTAGKNQAETLSKPAADTFTKDLTKPFFHLVPRSIYKTGLKF